MDYPEIIEEEFDSSSAGRGIQDTSNSSQSAPIAYPDMPHLGFEIGDGAEAASNRQSHLSSNWARSRPFGTKMASTTGMQPIQAYGSTHSFQPPGSTSSTHDQAPNGDGQSHTHQPAHKRNYQACEACRKRKVKCVLGPDPDNPTDPPCDRCKREHKECLFAETRKKTKLSDDADGNQNGRLRVDSSESQTFPTTFSNPSSAQRQRRLTSPTSIKPEILPSDSSAHASEHSISRHYTSYPSQFNQQPPYTPSQSTHTMAAAGYKRSATANGGSDEFQVRSAVAVDLLGAAAPTTHDNLSILSSAAAQLEEGNRQAQSAGVRSPSDAFDTPSTAGGALSQTFSNTMQPISIDVVLNGNTAGAGNPQQNSDIANAIKAWSSMRFVRAGWFRAEEAMNYVEYYYKNLSPMTPVATADFRHPSKHLALLTEEPLLAIAILTIASRYMKLSGSGSGTRAYQIHDKLWNYLRCMVERLLWGQEQFGGGFCGGGSTKIRPLKGGAFTWKGSLRTLGTIEALLLLTDWQPRALHFPPGDDENRLLDTDYDLSSGNTSPAGDDDQNETLGSNTRNLPYANWLEPSWRSDRMSWMLLGLAQALSFELGVFDRNHYDCQSSEHDLHSECARKRRVRRMVLVYVSQVSGRLGIPSMLPLQHWGTDPVFERDSKQQNYGQPEDPVDTMQSCWLEIATIMYKANQKIFPTKHYTHELLINGRYHERIEEFGPLLKAWKVNFEKVKPGLRPQMQNILIAEYEYARFYINSLGLQKVITDIKEYERNAREGAMSHESNGSYQKEPIPASVLDSFAIPNRAYTDEVADAARVVLRAVIDGLAPQGHLRNAPVRTYLRALAAIMFLLKTFCLGAGEGDVRYSLSLIYRSTELMGTDVVDDVHLCNQSAALIKVLTDHLRPSILRVKGSGPRNGSEAVSGEQSHNQTTHQNGFEDHSHAAKRQRTSSTNRRLPARSDPLEGIPAQPMADLSNYTFMPPPNYNQQQMTGNMDANLNISLDPNGDPSMSGTDPNTWNADWLAFPLDNLFNSSTGTVDQGFGNIGPTVGDRDMLELITNEHYDQWDVGVMNFGNGFH